MGTKRRSMFNPKFKSSRPARWELGRKLQGKETEAELEEQRLAEATALANEAVREAELETLRLEELRIADEAKAAAELKAKEEAETLRLQQLRLAKEAELKAKAAPAKKKTPARKKAVKKTKSTRKPRTKKD